MVGLPHGRCYANPYFHQQEHSYSTPAEKNGAWSLFQLGVLLIQTELFTMNDK
jgi:hypothetical protein